MITYVRRATESLPAPHVRVSQVVLIKPAGNGRSRDGRFPSFIVTQEPCGQVAAVGPTGNADSRRIDEAALFDFGEAGHRIASGTIARVVPDCCLKSGSQVVAASIIGFKDKPPVRSHELCTRRKGFLRG